MAYSRSSDFDFDGNDPGPGGFFHQRFESGKVMIGWGRRRTKWVQLDQAEITSFLTAAPQMVVTDDPEVTALLGQLAKTLTGNKPLTLAEISTPAFVTSHPEAGPRFATILAGPASGNIEQALEILTREIRAA